MCAYTHSGGTQRALIFVSQTFSGISFSIALNTEMSVFRSVIGRKCAGKNDGSNVPSKYGHGGLIISSSNIPGVPGYPT